MFHDLFSSVKDVFVHPFVLFWSFLLFCLFLIVQIFFTGFFADPLFTLGFSLSSFLVIIKENLFLFIVSIVIMLLFLFLSSVLVTYVVNLRNEQKNRFTGSVNVFWFSFFLYLVSFVLLLLGFFAIGSIWATVLLVIAYLILIFVVLPAIFVMPVLLPKQNLRNSLEDSWEFGKKNYGNILLLFILINVLFYILDTVLVVLDWLGFYSVFIYAFIFAFFFLWAINFVYSWHHYQTTE